MLDADKIAAGINGDLQDWLAFNLTGAFALPDGLKHVAPFPPAELMQNTTGLTSNSDFASHGCDILKALSSASDKPLREFDAVLDFGVGVGRLARMFKGFRGRYAGVDVDRRHVEWVASALKYVDAYATEPGYTLPFRGACFDCVISVSVFTHMNERDQRFYLGELARVANSGATLLLTVHGERALIRAETEPQIFEMLWVPAESIPQTRAAFSTSGFNFILQQGHLTSSRYEYGITFISEEYIKRVWSDYFDIVRLCPGAIHDFQDVVVLRAR